MEAFIRKLDTDLIIFDLDGTLIDSSEDIAWCANSTLKALGKPEMPMKVIVGHIGWGVRPLLEKLMPDEPTEAINEARGLFMEIYGSRLVVKTAPYPGVRQTLEHFEAAGKKMAIVTNKPVTLAQRILEILKLDPFFKAVLGGDSLQNKKPHPEPIEKVIRDLAAKAERSVIVGDSPVDCEAGKAAGAHTIGAAYGFRSIEELIEAGCDIIVGSFPELKEVIR